MPRPSKAVCSGPRPTSGSATTVSRGSFTSPANHLWTSSVAITVVVGESLPEHTKYLPSGVMFTPCGFFGTGT